VLFPGESVWEKYYVLYKDCRLVFLTNIKNYTFKHAYVISGIIVR
jgi:hypothetical protein